MTDYQYQINRTTSILGIAIFSDANWRSIYTIATTSPGDLDADPVAVFEKAMIATSTNIPSRIIYADESIERRMNVSVKLKKIDFGVLSAPVLTEFTTYLKNGNKLMYPPTDTFISTLNSAVIAEEVLPPHTAEMIIDPETLIRTTTYARELGIIQADELTQVLGQISKGLLSLAGSISEEVGTALEVAKVIGQSITEIADTTDMEVFNSTSVPAGKIAQKTISMDENNIYVRNLDYIHIFGDSATIPVNMRQADPEIVSAVTTVTHPSVLYSEFAGDYTMSKLRTLIQKRLLKNVKLQTTKFYNELLTSIPDKLGDPGVIFAGSPLDPLPPADSFYTATYQTYTHPSTNTAIVPFADRVYMQYRLKLNVDLARYEFPEPGFAGGFNEGVAYNSIWIDDMPFGFFVNGRWHYTRYATDLPYTPPPV
jgi:hypothetical protein